MIDLDEAKDIITKHINISFFPRNPIEWTRKPNVLGFQFVSHEDYVVTYALNVSGEFLVNIFLFKVNRIDDRLRSLIAAFNRAEPKLKLKIMTVKSIPLLSLVYEGRIGKAWEAADPLVTYDGTAEEFFYGSRSPGCPYMRELMKLAGK